jgi:hypothetical protein
MSLIQELYDNGKITSSELDKLAAIRQGLWDAMDQGPTATAEFIRSTFEGCDADELEKLSRMVEGVEAKLAHQIINDENAGVDAWLEASQILETSILKEAAAPGLGEKSVVRGAEAINKLLSKLGPTAQKWVPRLGGAALLGSLGLTLAHTAGEGLGFITKPIGEMVDRKRLKTQSNSALAGILKDNPELKKDPKTVQNFGVLYRYAPNTVASNRPVAEAMLKKMQQWGHVDPQSLQQMIKMESDHVDTLRKRQITPETEGGKLRPEMLLDVAGAGMA